MKEKTEKRVSAIMEGTVIDHIPANSLFKVIDILGLDTITSTITFGTNLKSQRLGVKGIIKISETFFDDADVNKIALIAPQAVLNIIRDYNVVEKKSVRVPDHIHGIVKCVNPKCVTNVENVKTKFEVVNKEEVALKCKYCEKITDQANIVIL